MLAEEGDQILFDKGDKLTLSLSWLREDFLVSAHLIHTLSKYSLLLVVLTIYSTGLATSF